MAEISLNVVEDNTLLMVGAVDLGPNESLGWALMDITIFWVIRLGALPVLFQASKPGIEFFPGRGYVGNGKFFPSGYF